MEQPAHIHLAQVPAVPVRKEPSDAAEMVTQLHFGEQVEVLAQEPRWTKIRSRLDGYEGWVDPKMIALVPDVGKIKEWQRVLSRFEECRVREGGKVSQMPIGTGSYFPVMEADEAGVVATLGARRITLPGNALLRHTNATAENVLRLSAMLLGTPYLWGGKTSWGTDCSGLVQTIFSMVGIDLPRDAYQQAKEGTTVTFDQAQAGDLAFFANDAGRIIHVGILIGDGEIRHAHGWVRDDYFREEGIINRLSDKLTHKLHSIQTILNHKHHGL